MSDQIIKDQAHLDIRQPDVSTSRKDHARSRASIKTGQRRRLAGIAGITAATTAAIFSAGSLLEMNQPKMHEPNKVELGTVTIEPSAILRTQPRVENYTNVVVGKGDPTISRDNLTLEGHPLKDQSFSIENALAIEFLNGDTYLIIKNVTNSDNQKLDLAVQIQDSGVKHTRLEGFANIQPDGTVRDTKGEIIPKDKIEQYTFPDDTSSTP